MDGGVAPAPPLPRCADMAACSDACGSDMWCVAGCVERTDVATLDAWSNIGRCQTCSFFPVPDCEDGSAPCRSACGTAGERLGTAECIACLDDECEAELAACSPR